jgi:YD repeat-containing protein
MRTEKKWLVVALAFLIGSISEHALASYSYDALGRRVSSTIGSVTTRYYHDGQNVIEERDGTDVRLRYHVNGAQLIDERVATFDDDAGEFTYYLLKENFSVAGTGNADGSAIERLDYSATSSFAGSGGGIDVD